MAYRQYWRPLVMFVKWCDVFDSPQLCHNCGIIYEDYGGFIFCGAVDLMGVVLLWLGMGGRFLCAFVWKCDLRLFLENGGPTNSCRAEAHIHACTPVHTHTAGSNHTCGEPAIIYACARTHKYIHATSHAFIRTYTRTGVHFHAGPKHCSWELHGRYMYTRTCSLIPHTHTSPHIHTTTHTTHNRNPTPATRKPNNVKTRSRNHTHTHARAHTHAGARQQGALAPQLPCATGSSEISSMRSGNTVLSRFFKSRPDQRTYLCVDPVCGAK